MDNLNTIKIVIFISPLAVLRFFNVRVGHNFDSNFLKEEQDDKTNTILWSHMLYEIYTSYANQSSTLKML